MSSLTSVWHTSEKIPEKNEGRNFEELLVVISDFRLALLASIGKMKF